MKSWTAGVLRTPKRIAVTVTICIAIAVLPLLVFLGYSLVQSHELQSRQLLQQRLFATRLAASTVAAELNSIRVFGNWYSRSPDIRALVSGKRWEALSKDMDRLVEQLPSLVRLFASDERGAPVGRLTPQAGRSRRGFFISRLVQGRVGEPGPLSLPCLSAHGGAAHSGGIHGLPRA